MLVSGVKEINNGVICKHTAHVAIGSNSELSETRNSVVERSGGRGGERGRGLWGER